MKPYLGISAQSVPSVKGKKYKKDAICMYIILFFYFKKGMNMVQCQYCLVLEGVGSYILKLSLQYQFF